MPVHDVATEKETERGKERDRRTCRIEILVDLPVSTRSSPRGIPRVNVVHVRSRISAHVLQVRAKISA